MRSCGRDWDVFSDGASVRGVHAALRTDYVDRPVPSRLALVPHGPPARLALVGASNPPLTNPARSVWARWLRQPQAFRLRRALFQIHLWSGIAVGLYVIAICVSGSVLVYRSELRQTFEPQPRFVTVSESRLGQDELTAAAESAYPGWTVSRVIERDDPARAVTVTLNRDGSARQMLFDPYNRRGPRPPAAAALPADDVAPRAA